MDDAALSKGAGFDPATTAGPFETAFQGVVGFAVFLWLASLLLQRLREDRGARLGASIRHVVPRRAQQGTYAPKR